jgi:hypothetical protein
VQPHGAQRTKVFLLLFLQKKKEPSLTLSESARATTAAEARFRVPYPNSRPRAAKLVALDRASEGLVRHIARAHSNRTWLALWPGSDAALSDATTQAADLIGALDATDLVVMVSTAGEDSPAAQLIAEACKLRNVPVVVFVLDTPERRGELGDRLAHLRPYASMLVRAGDAAYVEDMLTALRV